MNQKAIIIIFKKVSFGKSIKNYGRKLNYLLLDLLKACQSVVIKNITFSAFSFITAALQDVLDKNRDQNNTS